MLGESWKAEFYGTDYYLFKAAQIHWKNGKRASFEVFTRRLPEDYSYLLLAGIESVLEVIEKASREPPFGDDFIAYLRKKGEFSGDFLEYLSDLKFDDVEVYAMPEGTVFYAGEPVLRVEGPADKAQLLETLVLRLLKLQTAVASKAARVVKSAKGIKVYDFSPRGANDAISSLLVSRAAYIAGFEGTSNVDAGVKLNMPVMGTMPHALIQSFGSDKEGFETYRKEFGPQIALIDTYDIIEGTKEAIRQGYKGVRLDSGWIDEIRVVEKVIKDSGKEVLLFYSGDLDEYKIAKIVESGVKVGGFGVGRRLVSKAPSVDFSYKLVEFDGKPVTKFSKGKGYYPCRKQVFRREGKDIVAKADESYEGRAMLRRVFKNGRASYTPLEEIRSYAKGELENTEREVVFSPLLQKELEKLRIAYASKS